MSQTSRDRVNSRDVRTHKKNSGDAVRRLGTIMQNIFCAQSGATIRLTVLKWSGESRYPEALPLVLENFNSSRLFSRRPDSLPLGLRGWSIPRKHSVNTYVFPLASLAWEQGIKITIPLLNRSASPDSPLLFKTVSQHRSKLPRPMLLLITRSRNFFQKCHAMATESNFTYIQYIFLKCSSENPWNY